jgi:hypothetical protein
MNMLTICLGLVLTTMTGVTDTERNLDKSWTSPYGREAAVTQVQKQQEPADAGSRTAERAGFEPTVGLLPRGFSKAVL